MNTTRQKVIGFDFDGVIFDIVTLKHRIATEWGYKLTKEDVASSKIKEIMGVERYRELEGLAYDNEQYGIGGNLVRGVVDMLDHVRQLEIPFYLVSKRNRQDIPTVLLQEHGLWPHYFNESNVHFVPSKEQKNDIVIARGITDFIDDKISYLDVITSAPYRYLFDPYHLFSGQHQYATVGEWPDFINLINRD